MTGYVVGDRGTSMNLILLHFHFRSKNQCIQYTVYEYRRCDVSCLCLPEKVVSLNIELTIVTRSRTDGAKFGSETMTIQIRLMT